MLLLYFSIALGGAIGASSRYCANQWIMQFFPGNFAYGTLVINVVGSLLIGVLMVLIQEKALLPQSFRPFLVTGILGAFTTFSAFSLETVNHFMAGEYLLAAIYIVASVVLCLLACFAGISVARIF